MHRELKRKHVTLVNQLCHGGGAGVGGARVAMAPRMAAAPRGGAGLGIQGVDAPRERGHRARPMGGSKGLERGPEAG